MLRRGGLGLTAALALLAVAAAAMYLPSPQGAEEASTPLPASRTTETSLILRHPEEVWEPCCAIHSLRGPPRS
jgi:hypothetical protein